MTFTASIYRSLHFSPSISCCYFLFVSISRENKASLVHSNSVLVVKWVERPAMSSSTCILCTLKILCNSLVLPLYPPYIFINRPRPPHPLFSCSFSMFIFSFQKYTSSLVPCTTSGLVRPKFPITFCPTTNFTIHSALLLPYHHRYNLKLLLCTFR